MYTYIILSVIPLLSVALKGSHSVTKGGATWYALSGPPCQVPPWFPASNIYQSSPRFTISQDSLQISFFIFL